MAKSSGSAIRAGRAFVELFADDTLLIRGLKQAEARVRRFGKNIHDIGRRLATIGLAMSVPFIMSTKTFADFDDTMRAVKAVSNATGEEFEMLTNKAILLGRTTSFTAQQVADAMLMIGRAGFAPKEIDDSIKSILDLSRATKTDLSESARIASASLRAFDLEASEMPRVCDVMVAAANNSAQTLEDLGFSMSYCAPIAAQYGMTIEETCKAIGALSNYGIKASQAGTTFRRILVNLADKRVQRRLKGLGVEITNKDTGKMRNASAILKDLGKSMRFMSESQQISLTKDLFGVWAMAGSAKLTIANFERLYDAIDNAGNIANKTATEMDAGIGGRLRILWSEIEAVRIAIGEALAPVLIKMANYWIHAIGGIVQYIQKNKELVVSTAKMIAQITGVGFALVGTSMILLTVAKLLSIATGILGAVLTVLFMPLNLLAKVGNLVLFAGAALVNVFSSIGAAIYRTAMFLGSFAAAFFGVARTIVSVIGVVAVGIGRTVLMVAQGLLMASVFIVNTIAGIVTTIIPLIGSLIGTIASLLAPLASILGSVFAMIGSMALTCFTWIAAALAPITTAIVNSFLVIATAVTWVFSYLASLVASAFASVAASIVAAMPAILSAIGGFFAAIGAALLQVTVPFVALASTIYTAILVPLGGVLATVFAVVAGWSAALFSFLGTVAVGVGSFTVALVANLIAIVGLLAAGIIHVVGIITFAILNAMAPWAVVLVSIAAVAGAVYLLVRNFQGIASVFSAIFQAVGSVLTTIFRTIIMVVGTVVSWIVSAIMSVLGLIVRPILAVVAWIASGIWSLVKTIGSAIGSAIGAVVGTIRNAFASAWNGVVGMFASVLSGIGGLVANFGTFFSQAFAAIGESFDWFKGKIGEVFGFFREAYDAIAVALSRGDIEAALGVVWAGLKLIWVKGTHVLLEAWYWLTDTLQTAWATCVYKVSELLLTAWYGVQQFWTETVYTMQTLWTGMIDALIGAWQYAEKLIKKGVGYIKALWQGTDPKEVLMGIDEEYDRKAKEREKKRMESLNAIQKNRDSRFGSLEADKQGAIGSLKSDLEASAARRKEANKAKTAGFEQEYADARKAYDEAIIRAKTPSEEKDDYSPWDMKQRQLNGQLENAVKGFKGMGGLNGLLGDKAQSSGTFNSFELGSLNDSIGEDQLEELRNQTSLLRNLKFKGIPWKED